MPSGGPFMRDTGHVLRIAGALQPVNDDDGEGILSVALPMAVAEDSDAGFHFDTTGFWRGNIEATAQKKAG